MCSIVQSYPTLWDPMVSPPNSRPLCVPQNVPLLRRKALSHVLSEESGDDIMLNLGWALNLTIGVLKKRGHRQSRRPREDGGRERCVAAHAKEFQGQPGSTRSSPGISAGKESACSAGDPGSIPGSGSSNTPCSGLQSPTDCIVHGVTKSQTQLRTFSFTRR